MGYRIRDVADVRRRFRALLGETEAPILICPNHLTMADAAIATWALGGPWWLLRNYRWVPWNVPELSNFAGVGLDRAAAWMVKCIPIVRGGPRERLSHALRKIEYVVSRGEPALIFAEGTRSRTGRIQLESIAHGVGRIVSAIPDCHVLCVYLRGDRQETWSTVPSRGDSFYLDFELFRPSSENSGMRRSRDFAHQVADRLVRLEEKYFADRQ
jgi:1-acyl-sn-glycerol-3-phosphate acyltransferase